ncbi:hypothetical protein KCU81_g2137, partial [Aureobasidium melanogenum]|uniref:Uncharacterized protein n=1 Tax=Aureobasidium melanogenum (strain CBS 110374) TaxID=1043003 RepID=A0A074WI86_AURM1
MDPPWPTAAAPPIPLAPPCTQEQLDRVRAELAPRFRILHDLLDEQVAEERERVKERFIFVCVAVLAVKMEMELLADAEERKDKNVKSHQVVPVHMWDLPIRSAVVYHMSRFNAPLDANKLRDSLIKLIDRDGGWRKLGARLHQNDKKALELHIPHRFDTDQPAIAFNHEKFECTINEHPLASRLPSASQEPEIVACASDLVALMRSKGDPESFQDYLNKDRPILGLRVVTFDDATLVTLSCNHLLLDGLGGKAVLDAWSLVLHGREHEVPDLQGVYEDPLATLGTQSTVPYKHESRVMGVPQLILFGVRALLRRTFSKSEIKDYIICVPSSYVKELKSNALKEITRASDPLAETPFLSDSDVLCAWWSRYIASCMSKQPTETLVINNLLDLRPVLTPELFCPENPYVSNALMMMPTFTTAAQLLRKPLGETALSLRQTIKQLSTREQVEARFSLDREWLRRTGHPALYGDPWMRMIICTNWIKGKIHEVDFSPALLEGKSRNTGPVCPSYNQIHAIIKDFDLISGFAISKDKDGNYWIYARLDAKHRSKVEQMLSEEFWAD